MSDELGECGCGHRGEDHEPAGGGKCDLCGCLEYSPVSDAEPMGECHAIPCHRPATTTLKVGNNHSYRNRWTSGLRYCNEHAEWVAWKMADGGLRVMLEPDVTSEANGG